MLLLLYHGQVGLFLWTDLLSGAVLLMKKLEIEKTKTTLIISEFNFVYQVVLVFSNSDFFINKTAQRKNSDLVYL
jgi:hypothetical protein